MTWKVHHGWQPSQALTLGFLWVPVIVHDSVDVFPGGNFTFDGVEEANELLMAMVLRAAADHRAI